MMSKGDKETSVLTSGIEDFCRKGRIDRKGWMRARLGELSDFGIISIGRGNVISKEEIETNPGSYPVFSSSAVGDGIIGYYSNFMFDDERISWSIDGGGRFFYHPISRYSVTNVSGWIKVHKSNEISTKFLYLALDAEWYKKNFDYQTKAHPSVIKKEYTIAYPNLYEQNKITSIIDVINQNISIYKSLIAKYEAIKKSTVNLLLEPKVGWKTSPIGDLYSVSSGLSKGAAFFGKGYPFVSFSTIFNNPILPAIVDELVESTPKERQQYSVHNGDIFLTRTSETLDELGMSSVALCDIPHATFNGFSKRLRPKSEDLPIYPEFIAYYLRSNFFRNRIIRNSAMTTRASLSGELIKRLPIQYPSLSEQRKIAARILAIDNALNDCRAQLVKVQNLKHGMMTYFFG